MLRYIGNRRLNNVHRFLDDRIERAKNPQIWHAKLPCEPQEFVEHLREIYHQVPDAIARANEGRRRINDTQLVKLDARIGKALERRGVAQHVGAEHLCVDFWCTRDIYKAGFFTITPIHYWYAPQWFVDCAGIGDRRKLYKRFDDLKDADPDEIQSEVGLLLLGEVP